LKVTVDGVVTMDLQENLRGIERQIEQVRQAAAPDEQAGSQPVWTRDAGSVVSRTPGSST
jgi:hypothetical protein